MGSNVPNKEPLEIFSYLLDVFKIGTKSVLGICQKNALSLRE